MAGDDSRLMAALAYAGSLVFPIVIPLIVYIAKKDDKFARYHAMQAIILYLAFLVIWTIGFAITFISFITIILPFLLIPVLMLLFLAFDAWLLFIAYRVYTGNDYRIGFVEGIINKGRAPG